MSGKKLRIDEHMILIIEGIHALNPALTPHIPNENKYKVYVSALTTILLDKHYYRPIPQSFLDGITNESGAALTNEEKQAMQNPGY